MEVTGLIATVVFGLLMIAIWIDSFTGRKLERSIRASLVKREHNRRPRLAPIDGVISVKKGKDRAFPKLEGWEYLKWVETTHFESDGDVLRSIECMPLNTTAEEVPIAEFHVYSDDTPSRPWAKQGRQTIPLTLNWHPDQGVGVFKVALAEPLAAEHSTRIRYGYVLEGAARVGSDHWEKPVVAPIDFYKATVSAESPWVITAPRPSILTPDRKRISGPIPPLSTRNGNVHWTVRRPRVGSRLRLDWNTVNRGFL